jgi:2-keto-4-pentenoate hydratase/2-oxohepta-3-ene-1,7-dioic acid hydratase in catechol pathway
MKLVRYGDKGAERPGLLDTDGRVRDLSAHVADISGTCLTRDGLAALRALDPASLPLVEGTPQQDLRLGACVAGVGKFLAVGLNYADHAAEAGMDVPTEPILFSKWTSCIAGPDDNLPLPEGSTATDWEVELGIVIGDGGRNIAPDQTAQHIAGYCVINDISERDWQLRSGGTWDKGKGHDGFGPVGPWLVTTDELGEANGLAMTLTVNGVTRQAGNTRDMIFGVRQIVAYVSRFMTLEPGDIVATGTPAGVGSGIKPKPVFLREGDALHLTIEGLGEQRQRIGPSPYGERAGG